MIRTRTILLGCALGLVLASWSVLAQAPPMRPGRWEVTVEMSMPNAPVQMPAMTTAQCVTEEQIADPQSAIPTGPTGPGAPDDCKVSDFVVDGNEVSWKMACDSAQMEGDGRLTFDGDAYDGVMNMRTALGEMTMKLTGKRLGEC